MDNSPRFNLQILHKTHKGPKLNTLEEFKIYKPHKTYKNEISKWPNYIQLYIL